MTNNVVRDIPKSFLERALCYYFSPKRITSKEYHLQILVENIKTWQSYDFFQWKSFLRNDYLMIFFNMFSCNLLQIEFLYSI